MENITKLILAIVNFVTEKGGYITKTKLLKYLYLFDIEFFRFYGKTYTGFNWIYYHYGPWTKEYEELYENMARTGALTITSGTRSDLETQFISTEERIDLEKLFKDIEFEFVARRILSKWLDEPLGKMLDYVYFYTEPMEGAEKNRPLDFSRVVIERKKPYELPKSTLSRGKIDQIKKEFYKESSAPPKVFPEPKIEYDEIYWEGLSRLLNDKEY